MKFASFTINNLFSYRHGYFEFPLDLPPERNVILIHGRNGFGKTSFINAIKLLFLGLDREILDAVRPGVKLNPQRYLLGTGEKWEGAFNRQAREENSDQCSVSLCWYEEQGTVTTTRSWTFDGLGNMHELLQIKPGFKTEIDLTDPVEASAFLEQRMPRALLPFFVYDAEQVQRLADMASDEEATLQQIESLLDITAVKTAETFLDQVIRKMRREAQASKEQIQLEQLQTEQQKFELKKKQIENDILEVERDISDTERQIDDIEGRLARANEQVLQKEGRRLSQRKEDMKVNLERLAFSVLEMLPEQAPLLSHPQLIKKAASCLAVVVQDNRSILAGELKAILEHLPKRLLDDPQHPKQALDPAQIRFLKAKLEGLLQTEIILTESERPEGAWSLNPERAAKLDNQLRDFASADANRVECARQLKEIGQLTRQLRLIETELDQQDDLPKDKLERIRQRQEERQQLASKRDMLRENLGALKSQLPQLATEIGKLKTVISAQEKQVSRATRNQLGVDCAERTLAGVRNYRELLRARRRQEIELAVNRRFAELMQSHGLIHSLHFDQDFRLSYHDASDRPVGMANISAGMKQLVAQALLWGMKDIAARDFPVVIDTPLARIEAGHQRQLLTRYYPNAASQVIVLPTDSEIDREKYRLIQPHLAKEFQLWNPSGQATEVRSGQPMYDIAEVS